MTRSFAGVNLGAEDLIGKIYLSSPVTLAAVSSAVVDSLFIDNPLFVFLFLAMVLQCST